MTIKVYNSSTWNPQKSLKLYASSIWNVAKKGWIYDGFTWNQFYPEYPLNTVAPSVSGTATQGNALSAAIGTWTSTDAYNPVSYSYQWTSGVTNISNATSSTYTTVVGDVGNAISCKITATNNRGSTTVSASNSITVVSAIPGPPSNLSLSDSTDIPPTPGALSVSNVTTTSLNFSFGAATGTFTAYEVLTSNSNHVVSGLNQSTRTGTVSGATAGDSYYIAPYTTNTNCKLTASWAAGTNATSYDIYVGGTYIANTASTSYTYTAGSAGLKSVTIYSKNSSGTETTGVSGNVTLAKRYSSPGTAASGNFLNIYTVTWDANGGSVSPASNTVTQGNSTTAPTPTRSGYSFNGWYNATSGGSLIVSGGSSYTPSSSITLYAQWTAQYVVSWNLNGGDSVSPSSSSTAPGGSVTAPTPTRAGYTFLYWRDTPSLDFLYSVNAGGSFTPPSSITMYARWLVNASPTAPSTPTGLVNTYSTGPSWTGSWTASTGTAPITYFWTLKQSTSSGGTVTATQSGSTTGTSFTQAMSSANGLWAQFTVYASNSAGNSSVATSGWA